MINITQEEIMKNWQGDINQPVVSVRCITYNHENYIAQALDGFLMQKTNFPFEVIVHDDASPDRTAGIVREYEKKYPAIIKAIYQTENQYSKWDGSIGRIMDAACKGKYIALCEGDDYWIDENKLQMQVDFLEAHSDYAMCYTQAKQFFENKNIFSRHSFGKRIKNYEELFIYGSKIPTPTVVCRKENLDDYNTEFYYKVDRTGWRMGDLPQWLYFFRNSKVKYFARKTAVYRILQESASHTTDINKQTLFTQSSLIIRSAFVNYYKDSDILDVYQVVSQFNSYWNDRNYLAICNIYRSIPFKYRTFEYFLKFIYALIKR